MDGKLFLYNNATPPPMSQVAATTFIFDLQRFALSTMNKAIDDAQSVKDNIAQGDHPIQVKITDKDADGNVTNTLTYYCDDMQTALNSSYEKVTVPKVDEGETYTADDVYASNRQVEINLLKDMDGKAFQPGGYGNSSSGTESNDVLYKDSTTEPKTELDNDSAVYVYSRDNIKGVGNVKDYHITINLGGHTYGFTNGIQVAATETSKGIQIVRNRADSKSDITIKNGTLKVADKTETPVERIIRSYVDTTLTDVTIDGSKTTRKASDTVYNAVIAHTCGTLTLDGNTSITTRADSNANTFYAVDLHYFAATDASKDHDIYYNANAKAKIVINTTGNIKDVGFSFWNSPVDTFSFREAEADKLIDIQKGTVSSVALASEVVKKGGMSKISIGENATVGDITDPENLIAYESTSGVYTVANVGWASDSSTSNKYNYLTVDDADKKSGKILLSASDVANKDRLTPLVNMGENASLFGVPYDAKITWTGSDTPPTGYNVAYLNYNNGETAVTLKTAADAIIQSSVEGTANGILATTVRDIDASDNTFAVTLKGHASDANTLRGGTGDDSLSGGTGSDIFGYNGGADKIADYTISDNAYDTVVLSSDIDLVTAADAVTTETGGTNGNLVITFGDDKTLTFEGQGTVKSEVNGVKIQSGKTIYNYSNRSIADDDSITLTSNYTTTSGALSYRVSNYSKKVDASAVTLAAGIAITGNDKDNYIIGSNYVAESEETKTPVKNTLYGGAGNDTLTGGAGEDVFQYSDGKDFIEGYSLAQGDKASMAAGDIVSAKSSRKGLAFTFKNSKNVLTFSPDDKGDIAGKISLSGANAGYLTQDGYVNKDTDANFKLFSGTKGAIDLTDTATYGEGKISSIDASITKNGVTITGDEHIKSLTFGKNNKKDLFEYGGGLVTISGFETGKDRIDIGNIGPITSFEVGKDDKADDVLITIKDAEVISLTSVKDKEVLMRDAEGKSNSFSKYVFHANGILYNKEKKPTEANIYSNVVTAETKTAERIFTADDSVKKIFLQSGVANVSIQSGNNKATLDASAAGFKAADDSTTGVGVSLVGGTKNNKFTGTNYADTFYYNGGKDNVTNFQFGESVTDSIALGDTSFKIEEAKISLARKSLKFKFDSKNTLALKSDSTISGALYVDGKEYTFEKNAIGVGGNVSLTSQFSGTYKLANGTSAVDGRAVKKNLTFKGTDAGESLVGGLKKTTFKGGGGNDTLVGNATGKDIFFYAKGDKGTTKIVDFGFSSSDKLKIANGTISDIKQDTTNKKVTFAMTSGKKGETTDIGWFEVDTSKATSGAPIAIKANNTYYWFADGGETLASSTEDNTLTASAGDLITLSRKVTARDVSNCAVIDLGYSTNLVKKELAFKVVDTTALPTATQTSQDN